jgi:hypothetical protein
VFECDREASIIRRPCKGIRKKYIKFNNWINSDNYYDEKFRMDKCCNTDVMRVIKKHTCDYVIYHTMHCQLKERDSQCNKTVSFTFHRKVNYCK